MRSGARQNFWLGIAALATSGALFICIPLTISDMSSTGVSGRAFPYVINTFLGILGVALTLSSLKGRPEKKEVPRLSRAQIKDIILWLGIVCLYALGISYVGFLVSTFFAVFACLWFLGMRRPVPLALMTLVLPPLLWWFFHKVVEVQFPQALLI